MRLDGRQVVRGDALDHSRGFAPSPREEKLSVADH
jgi:hypothetical protein